ncbi:hypothetical protein [Collimonas humicola]|uniref:hypothetical protein n=1 Tax=Collimonas humicola TaxID=2825886 RepID=UPI001B8CA62D|nr:hypothetical protein [Collimonas humicola]
MNSAQSGHLDVIVVCYRLKSRLGQHCNNKMNALASSLLGPYKNLFINMRKIIALLFTGLISIPAFAGACYIEKIELQKHLKTEEGNILLYFINIPKERQQIPIQVKWAERLDYLVSDGEIWGWEVKNKSALVLHNNDEIHVQGGSVHDWCDLKVVITSEKKGINIKAINMFGGQNQFFDYFVDAKEIIE